jgi:organic hydroperoxide reductase OsmC/OhrA
VWTPENLLVAALADCYILMFRAVARASRLEWGSLECRAEGKLERVEGVTSFSRYELHAVLTVPEGTDLDKARRLMEKAEKGCLVSNSLKAERVLRAEIRTV